VTPPPTATGRLLGFEAATDTRSPMYGDSSVDVDRWFALAWPMALLFHLGGNSQHLSALVHGEPSSVALGQLAMVVAAAMVMVGRRRRSVVALAVIHLAVTVDKLPVIGNHELILALVSLVVVVAVLVSRPRAGRWSWLETAVPGLRWLFLVSYGSIAFSKLNTGFLDLGASCATLFGDEMGRWLGLTVSDHTALAALAVYGTVIIELLVPILVLIPRTRFYGVLLGLGFHGFLALDPTSHVFDFTSTLTPLLLLFAPVPLRVELSRLHRSLGSAVAPRSFLGWMAVTVAVHLLILRGGLAPWLVPYPLWLAVTVTLGWWFVRHRPPTPGVAAALGRPSWVVLVVVALAALNGAAPYLELKTATGFNMYSNLHTSQGRSNHLLVPATVPLRRVDLVTVQAPDDHDLAYYAEPDLALPRENLERALGVVLEPETETSIQWSAPAGQDPLDRLTLVDTATGRRLVTTGFLNDRSWPHRAMGWMAHKFALRRTVVTSEPRACLRSWGPAY
jgi:hypothetical protein